MRNPSLEYHHKLYYRCKKLMFNYEMAAGFRSLYAPLSYLGLCPRPDWGQPHKPPFALPNLPKCHPEAET